MHMCVTERTVRGGFCSSLYLDIASLETNTMYGCFQRCWLQAEGFKTVILSESPISVCNGLCSLHLTHLHLHSLSLEWTPDQTSTAWQDISHTSCYSKDLTYPEHSVPPLNQHKPTALVVLTLQIIIIIIICIADTESIRTTPGTSLQLHLWGKGSVRSLSWLTPCLWPLSPLEEYVK